MPAGTRVCGCERPGIGGCRMGTKGRLNNEGLELGLKINRDLRLSNRGLMKKSGSLGGL